MPLHDFYCQSCDSLTERFVTYTELGAQHCYSCGEPVKHIYLRPAAVHGDLPEYTCPVTGKLISGRAAHEENLKRQGCRVYESGETAAIIRAREASERALDRSIDSHVDATLESMPSRTRERLFAEVEAGATATYQRL